MWLKNIFTISLFSFISLSFTSGQTGYNIDVELDGAVSDTLYLAYFYGDANYIRDTAYRAENGHFVFSDDEKLPEGVYMFVLPPENSFIQVLIGEEQRFSMKTNAASVSDNTVIEGSEDNELFYDYLAFLDQARKEKSGLQEKKEKASGDGQISEIESEIIDLDRKVLKKQDAILSEHPQTLTALVIGSSREPEGPDFSDLPRAEQQKKSFQYYHDHYFDRIDLRREAVLRTPFIHQKVMDYFEKYTYQEPDSLNKAVDRFLGMLDEESNIYRYFLVKLLNKYANPTIVGQDAVYVHIAQNYYGKGKAPWVDEETLEKILDNAERFSFTLIGKPAPALKLYDIYKEEEVNLRDIKAPYKVLIFWSSSCSHCEKVMPTIPEIIEEINDPSVKFVTVCTRSDESCKEFTEEHNIGGAAVHTLPVSAYGRVYDVRATPKVFIINEENKIASKGIGFSQIAQVIDMLRKEKNTTDLEATFN